LLSSPSDAVYRSTIEPIAVKAPPVPPTERFLDSAEADR